MIDEKIRNRNFSERRAALLIGDKVVDIKVKIDGNNVINTTTSKTDLRGNSVSDF